jgi:hypothetical protein
MRDILRKLAPALVLVVGISGCSKSGGGSGGAAGGSSGDAADLGYLPVDSMVVAGINTKQLQSSAIWKQHVEPRLTQGDTATQLAEFKAKCGFDPTTSVTSISIGAKGVTGKAADAVIVLHGLEKAKTLECFDKMKDDLAKQGTSFVKDGEMVTLTMNGQPAVLTFANDTTTVIGMGAYATIDGVKAAAAGSSALKASPAFVDMYKKLDTSKSIWFFVNGKLSGFEMAESMVGARPKSVFGSLHITDGLAVDARMRLESDQKASDLAKTFQSQIQGLKTYAKDAALASDGPDVRLTLSMTQENLKELAQAMGPMLGMMLGGM